MKKRHLYFLLLIVTLSLTVHGQNTITEFYSNDELESGFKNPPNEAIARTWWHWLSGNVSKNGITADLEAMKQVGIQEAQLFNVHLDLPKGPLKYLSADWLD